VTARILFGISAWADPGLLSSGFYPPEVRTAASRLQYYATRFSVAEVDATYHSFATARNIAVWLDNTPPGFAFNLRAFSLFTGHPTPFASLPRSFRNTYAGRIEERDRIYAHHLPADALDDLWNGFARTAAAFHRAGKLGALLFQFPPWFHPTPENYAYLAACRRRLPGFPVAVEFRVGSWLEDQHRSETLAVLARKEIALVCVDEPQGLKTSVPPLATVTAPLAVVRFHGRNRERWEQKGAAAEDRFNYLYGSAELREWAPRLADMAGSAETLHIIFKNKHADFPVRNALEMQSLLRT
jgi:uncharacterized protein YecE (DUF72 family)